MKAKTSFNVPDYILRRNFYIARKKKGLSRRELSEWAGVGSRQIEGFEKGRSWISDPCKIMIANILEKSVYHLFFEEFEDTMEKRMKLKPDMSKLKYIDIFPS